MASSDQALLERWINHRDAEAFAQIVSAYSGMVFATCRRILGNAADAEDITQECFLRLSRGDTAIHSSLGGWLHVLATHRCLDLIRSQASRRKREADHVQVVATTEREVGWDEIKAVVDEAIAELPINMREPLVQHFFGGTTHDEIAAGLNISRSAVTHRIGKGVELVRKRLARKGLLVGAAALTTLLPAHALEAVPATLAENLGALAVAGTGGGPLPAATLKAKALAAGEELADDAATFQPASTGASGHLTRFVVGGVVVVVVVLLLFWGAQMYKQSHPNNAAESPPHNTEFQVEQR